MTISVSSQSVWTGTTVPTTTSGNVGIANTTPAARLDIVGSSSVSSLKIKQSYNTLGGSVANISEIYTQAANIFPTPPPILVNWLSTGGVFGLRSLSNTANESRMMYSDNAGNVKSSGITVYSSPTFGDGTIINSVQGIAYLHFLDNGTGTNNGGVMLMANDFELFVNNKLQAFNTITAPSFFQTSDKRLKENIAPLEMPFSKLSNIKSYSYTFKDREGEGGKSDGRTHFGFIAQDVEKEFPNLVNIDKKGNYSLNYVEFIPLLLNEIKDQKNEINELKVKMESLETKMDAILEGKKSTNKEVSVLNVSLEQNVPNPFNQEAVIKFNANGNNAFIGIYDLSGRQVEKLPIKKGEKQVVVSAHRLAPGTYLYNLVVDGKMLDSKKMIVTN